MKSGFPERAPPLVGITRETATPAAQPRASPPAASSSHITSRHRAGLGGPVDSENPTPLRGTRLAPRTPRPVADGARRERTRNELQNRRSVTFSRVRTPVGAGVDDLLELRKCYGGVRQSGRAANIPSRGPY